VRSAAWANLALAIASGAFGAHTLARFLTEARLETFKTGQFYHLAVGLAWLILVSGSFGFDRQILLRSSWALAVGTVFFTGSLTALALTGIRLFGAITPIGGVIWIVTFLALAFLSSKREPSGTRSDSQH
jgi:uncharacterized membrane protein YgdD (TMEM256/DUF423 family)